MGIKSHNRTLRTSFCTADCILYVQLGVSKIVYIEETTVHMLTFMY